MGQHCGRGIDLVEDLQKLPVTQADRIRSRLKTGLYSTTSGNVF